jgi:hypothetical protein
MRTRSARALSISLPDVQGDHKVENLRISKRMLHYENSAPFKGLIARLQICGRFDRGAAAQPDRAGHLRL